MITVRRWLLISCLLALNLGPSYAQNAWDGLEGSPINTNNDVTRFSKIDGVLLDEARIALIEGIHEMNTRKAAIAYNIANGSTPGFKPIRFPDEIEAMMRLYGDTSYLDEINIDDEMVKATQVRLRHSAYVKLLTTMFGITKKAVTLGKSGA